MKQQMHIRLLSLMLAAVLVLGLIPGASAAPGGLRWKKSPVEPVTDRSDRLVPSQIRTPDPTKPTDSVRVSIVLEDAPTLMAGYATEGIAENADARAYDLSLLAHQQDMATAISRHALGGKALDVVWNLEVLERRESVSEPAVQVSVYMAFPKADKLEHVIQKATELGVYEIVAFPSARCVSKPDEKSLKKKLERWQKIAASAAEQSGRGRIPRVVILPSFAEALKRGGETDLPMMFYENEQATTLHMALNSGEWKTAALLTGPEGGLEEKEVAQAMAAGWKVCTLGKRILRCETAPLCALSAVMYAAGEF